MLRTPTGTEPMVVDDNLPFATIVYVVANGRSVIIWIFFSNAIPNCETKTVRVHFRF